MIIYIYPSIITPFCYQDFNSFAQYMSQFRSAEFLQALSDLHVLLFLAGNDIMPLRYSL